MLWLFHMMCGLFSTHLTIVKRDVSLGFFSWVSFLISQTHFNAKLSHPLHIADENMMTEAILCNNNSITSLHEKPSSTQPFCLPQSEINMVSQCTLLDQYSLQLSISFYENEYHFLD